MVNRLVAFLISISQMFNTIFGGGDPDQMLSSWAWQEQDSGCWPSILRWSLDTWIIPIAWWKSDGKTHCESCWHFEKQRLINRYKEVTSG